MEKNKHRKLARQVLYSIHDSFWCGYQMPLHDHSHDPRQTTILCHCPMTSHEEHRSRVDVGNPLEVKETHATAKRFAKQRYQCM